MASYGDVKASPRTTADVVTCVCGYSCCEEMVIRGYAGCNTQLVRCCRCFSFCSNVSHMAFATSWLHVPPQQILFFSVRLPACTLSMHIQPHVLALPCRWRRRSSRVIIFLTYTESKLPERFSRAVRGKGKVGGLGQNEGRGGQKSQREEVRAVSRPRQVRCVTDYFVT